MATAGLLALIDDIATLLDDVALLSKVAAKKTAGVLGDDLALNAEQVSGLKADRELAVVWAVAKGSVKNKLILVPAALLISAFIPWLVLPLMMVGGGYLCFEGFEKVWHKLAGNQAHKQGDHQNKLAAISNPKINLVDFEKEKIRGAIRTDFILSAEIVVITLGTVKEAVFSQQVLVVCSIAAVITIAVYGTVAGIVKLDDLGLYLQRTALQTFRGRTTRLLGRAILNFCPYLMKALAILGTIAMFLVGGGILAHGVPIIVEVLLDFEHRVIETLSWPGIALLLPAVFNALIGLVAGGLIYVAVLIKLHLLPKL